MIFLSLSKQSPVHIFIAIHFFFVTPLFFLFSFSSIFSSRK